MYIVTIFPFVVDRVTYLIFARKNNHYGGICLDAIGKNNIFNITQQNELICRLFYFITDNLSIFYTGHNLPKEN